MELKDKIVVITGAASGIGRALALRFHQEGARKIVCADLNSVGVQATANSVDGVAKSVDVGNESGVRALVEETEDEIGPIDLFCSNAGIGAGPDLASDNVEWQRSWDVNVMSHVYAARHVVPRMVARGGGYLLNTSSAAGLLNQIGGAAYGVTKHAAVGFGEWVALTYAHQGIRVSLLCPQAVRTAMTTGEGADSASSVKAAASDGMMEPEELAEIVVEGLREERFIILTHPEVLDYMRRKTGDYDRWIKGMNRLQQRILATLGQ